MNKNLATEMAPPFVLVAHYFIAAAVFYGISAFLLPYYASEIGGYFLSHSLAVLVHLYLLGFVMMVIFGAMYQLVPVVLEIPIFSKDFAYIQFYLFVGGIVLFCYALWDANFLHVMPYGAMMMYLSMLIFVANIFLTYRKLEQWSIVAKFLFVANIFLLIGVSLGLFMSLDLIYGFYGDIMKMVQLHIGSTIFGYIMMSIMGVGMVLLPMFSLAHNFKQKAIEYAYFFISIGLILFFVGTLFSLQIVLYIGGVFVFLSIILFLYQMYSIFSKRIRKQNDFWAKNMIASFFSIIVAFVFLIVGILSGEHKYFLLFGFSLFFGFFIFFIIGHIYKILPFLVWYERFSPLVGKVKVPMLNEMIQEDVADVQFWITLAGMILGAISIVFGVEILFTMSAYIMGIGTLLVLYNIIYTLRYTLKDKNVA